MLNVAIVDDDREAAKLLAAYLERYGKEFGETFNIRFYGNGMKFLSDFSANIDIIFMDVNMPEMNGFEVMKNLRAIDSTVALVFITNLAQYAINGYEYDAMDYILKPVRYKAFALKIKKVISYCKKRKSDDFYIVTGNGGKRFPGSSVLYVESDGHHITYHTTEGEIPVYGTMKNIEQMLSGKGFFRCNSCYIVNLRYVKDIDGFTVTVGGDKLTISHPRKKSFLEAVHGYYGNISCEGGNG